MNDAIKAVAGAAVLLVLALTGCGGTPSRPATDSGSEAATGPGAGAGTGAATGSGSRAATSSATGAGAAEQGSDAAITSTVRTALLKDADIEGTAITVEVVNGAVRLSGFVRSKHERERAGMLARQVAGVVDVRNDLQLRQDQ